MSTRVKLSFQEELMHEPIVAQLVRRFDIEPNIRKASIEAQEGWLVLDLDGTREAVDGAVSWLEEIGVKVERLGDALDS